MTDAPMNRRHAMVALAAPFALALVPRTAFAQDPTPQAAPPVDVDATPYPSYAEDASVKGIVRCVGSSAVGVVLNAARAGFRESQPDIEIEMISSGSASGPKALAAGESILAPMSRAMKPGEIEEIEKARGGKVDFIDIAIDAIAICVNVKNPTTRLSMVDLDRIFGRERRRGGGPAVKWSDVGVRDPRLADRTITLFGMGAGTGSSGIVQDTVLKGGAFRTSVNEEPVSSSVVQAIATEPSAIGYCSVLFDSVRVRKLEIEAGDGSGDQSGFVGPTDDAIRSGRYPLARALRLYFVRESLRQSPAACKLLQFLVSQDGQEIVEDLGQKTLSPKDAHLMFDRVALDRAK